MKVIEGESVDENIPVPVKLVTEENVSEFLQ
jgi:ABC-type sugar transport system substrate-binding protein